MSAAKLIVMYPTPKDLDAFERDYREKHLPMAAPIFEAAGATKAVLTKVSGAMTGTAPIHRIAEIHFASQEALNACLASQQGRDALGNARDISNGGAPTILLAKEDIVTFGTA